MEPADRERSRQEAERWDRLAGVFERASALPEGERSSFLEIECRDDPDLRDEVDRMLRAKAPARRFLEPPRAVRETSPPRLGPDAFLGQRIGSYRILRAIGGGGMGAVYEAEQENPRRRVALKVMLLGQGSATARRFRYEAAILARLKHPGIAQVYESGVHVVDADGEPVEVPWFALEYVEGARTLLEFARERRIDDRAKIALVLEVCAAVGFGHEKGVIHRDVKPSNLLVDPAGHVKVIDFGVARLRDPESAAQTLLTRVGEIVGTLQYMSPEQVDGDTEALDVRSDVYAIGLVLYELLCGRPPYDLSAMSLSTAARNIRDAAPIPPRTLRPDLPSDLGWILLKALEKDPAGRYASAPGFAEDLRRFLAHQPVLAGPPSTIYRLKKFVRRHAVGVGAGILIVLAIALGVVGLAVGLHQAVEAQAAATRKADDVLALSAIQELRELVDRADLLWPALPDRIPEYDRWLADARVLIEGRAADPERGIAGHPGLRDHEKKLAEIRLRARPPTPEQIESDRRASPAFAEWEANQAKLLWVRRMRREEPWPDEAETRASLAGSTLPSAASDLNVLAWALVDTDPEKVVYGKEIQALVLAKRGLDVAADADRAPLEDTLAWAFFRCGRFDDALAEESVAMEGASDELRGQFEASQQQLREQVARWTGAAGQAEAADLERTLSARVADLDREVSRRRTFEFDDAQDRWWHAQLSQLVGDLNAFTDEKEGGLFSAGTSAKHGWGIGKRAAFARTIRENSVDGPEARRRWDAAIAAIAKSSSYGGLRLAPQLGLLPIGEDPDSHLWEFAHLQSGTPAERGPDGRLLLREETGLVFVLIPGGSFWMGAQETDPGGRDFDPNADEDESPVRELTLDPFFLSKYEMTQGQWLRSAGANPSNFLPGRHKDGQTYGLLNPVEQVNWYEACEQLRRLDLVLPTEAQWERGARAGTESVWWTGDDKTKLAGAANLADKTARAGGRPSTYAFDDWLDDGWLFHARVGSFRANAFGLHDVVGNLSEWCRDGYGSYGEPVREGDGERILKKANLRIVRGGNFNEIATEARSAVRRRPSPETMSNLVGMRPARAVRP